MASRHVPHRPASASRSRGGSLGIWPWLGLAVIIVMIDQFTKTLILGYYKLGDCDLRDELLQRRAGAQHGGGVLVPGFPPGTRYGALGPTVPALRAALRCSRFAGSRRTRLRLKQLRALSAKRCAPRRPRGARARRTAYRALAVRLTLLPSPQPSPRGRGSNTWGQDSEEERSITALTTAPIAAPRTEQRASPKGFSPLPKPVMRGHTAAVKCNRLHDHRTMSIQAVAAKAGVSVATVSRAFNFPEKVTPGHARAGGARGARTQTTCPTPAPAPCAPSAAACSAWCCPRC
jgi:hypothetical protein